MTAAPPTPRVLLVANLRDPAAINVRELLLGALRDGWDVHLLCEEGGDPPQLDLAGIPPPLRRSRVHHAPASPERSAPCLQRYAPDLVHLLGACAPEWIPLARRRGARTLITVSSDLIASLVDAPGRHRTALELADAVQVSRPAHVEVLLAAGARKDSIHLIEPGADVGWLDAPSAAPRSAPPVRVLTIAPLAWSSGLEHALAAARRLTDRELDCRLRIVGSGPHRTAVTFARYRLGLEERVELVEPAPGPWTSHLQWADLLLDAGLVPGAPEPVLDAQAAGVPVVSTAPPEDAPEAVVAVPPLDPEAIAAAVAAVCEDAARRGQLVGAGRARARSRVGASVPAELRRLQHELWQRATAAGSRTG